MLSAADLHTYYGKSHVLRGISLDVAEGSCVGVLGRNGMGKTTLVRSLMGLIQPRAGRVWFQGRDVTRLPAFTRVSRGMAVVPQGRRIFASLTLRENLAVARRSANPGRGWDLERVYALFPGLRERSHHRGRELSGGEQQMLAIARALMTNPALLLFDEPTEGLAPLVVARLQETLWELKRQGVSLLLVEQNIPFALGLADYLYVVEKGEVVYQSSRRDPHADAELVARYLAV